MRNFQKISEFVLSLPDEAATNNLQIAMKTIPVSLILASLLAPLCANAQSPDAPPPPRDGDEPGNRPPHRPFIEAWKKADTDGDGHLSREEFSSMPRIQKLPEDKHAELFDRLDKNKDDKLSPAELHRNPNGRHPGGRRLWELDVDKSGGVSFEEFKAGPLFEKLPEERQKAIFQRLDTDGDGMITRKDKPEPPDGKRPKRGDGPPRGEHRPDPNRMLRNLDKDSDGSVTFDEFRAGPRASQLTEDEQKKRFEKMDRNKDLKLTPEDFPGQPPKP